MKKLFLLSAILLATIIGFSQSQNLQKKQVHKRELCTVQSNNVQLMQKKQLRIKAQVQKNYQIQKALMNQQRTGTALMRKQMLKKKSGLAKH